MKLGIDPGITGAMALVTDCGKIVDVFDMPITPKLSGKGNMVNGLLLSRQIEEAKRIAESEAITVYLEQVGPMRGQGVTSMFGFGRSLGVVEGVIAAHGLPVNYVTPQAWKKRAGLLKKPKEAAITLCLSLWPGQASLFSRKKDVGRADATLIARYGEK